MVDLRGWLIPMNVFDAVNRRRSVRAFEKTPVDRQTVIDLLAMASRAPSGGNVQPWKVHVLMGESLQRLSAETVKSFDKNLDGEEKDHLAYPPDLGEPYRARRSVIGHQLYETIGVARADRAAKMAHLRRTFAFFDAPVGMLIAVDRVMEPIQWTDVGIFLQTLILLAEEKGLGTCAQGFWSYFPQTIRRVLELGHEQIVICGLALGHPDENAVINQVRSERAPLEETMVFYD